MARPFPLKSTDEIIRVKYRKIIWGSTNNQTDYADQKQLDLLI